MIKDGDLFAVTDTKERDWLLKSMNGSDWLTI
jgi:hypothetical protein